MEQEFEIVKDGTVIVFRLLEMDCPGDHWVIIADYVREYPASQPTPRAADACPECGGKGVLVMKSGKEVWCQRCLGTGKCR